MLKSIAIKVTLFSLLLLTFLFVKTPQIYANPCTLSGLNIPLLNGQDTNVTLTSGVSNSTYSPGVNGCDSPQAVSTDASGTATFIINCSVAGNHYLSVSDGTDQCGLGFDSINAPSSCVLTIPNQPLTVGVDSNVSITFGLPGTIYNIDYPGVQNCSGPSFATTNSSGVATFNINCPNDGAYSMSAVSSLDQCSSTFNVVSDATTAGTYPCVWVLATCKAGANNCNDGFDIPEPNICEGRSKDECTGSGVCLSSENAANSCSGQGGAPNIPPCPDGSDPIPAIDIVPPFICCPLPGNCGIDLEGRCSINKCNYGYSLGEPYCLWPMHCCNILPGSGSSYFGEEICKGKGINTAIGCLLVENTNDTSEFLLKWAVGVGAGIAFLLMVFGGIMMITGSGNPKRIQAGKELFAGAASGLLLIIASVFILRIVGVEILGIPGL